MTGAAPDAVPDPGDAAEALEWILGRVTGHDDKIAEHSEQIAALQRAAPDAGGTNDEAETDEEALQKYVDHLNNDFAMNSEIRKAWQENPAVVQELDALRRLRDYAYSNDASAYDRVTYHDAVERVRDRLVRHHARRQKKGAVRDDG